MKAVTVFSRMMLWLNGEWKEEGEAAVAASDGAFLRGEGVFETMLALGGEVFEGERHWGRLSLGCQRFGLEVQSFEEIRPLLRELLERNELTRDGERVRVRVTCSPQSLCLSAQVSRAYSSELRLLTTNFCRNERSALSGVKAISYAENSLALAEGKKAGAHEVLFTNTQAHWCEGAWSNVFAVEAGRLITPPLESGCLRGVTREVVMALADAAGIQVGEEVRTIAQVAQADELFLTSSLMGIGAVRHFAGRAWAEGAVTRQLARLLQAREANG